MSNVLAKVGSLDNVSLYEHYCDTTADLANIPKNESTLGSTAIVVDGENGFEAYMADSEGEWKPLVTMSGGSSDGGSDSDSGNPGYTVEEAEKFAVEDVEIYISYSEGSPTAYTDDMASLLIPLEINTIKVVIDGTTYNVDQYLEENDPSFYAFGAPVINLSNWEFDFSNYPFVIYRNYDFDAGEQLPFCKIEFSPTLDNSTLTISISYQEATVTEVSNEFKSAVEQSLWTKEQEEIVFYENDYVTFPEYGTPLTTLLTSDITLDEELPEQIQVNKNGAITTLKRRWSDDDDYIAYYEEVVQGETAPMTFAVKDNGDWYITLYWTSTVLPFSLKLSYKTDNKIITEVSDEFKEAVQTVTGTDSSPFLFLKGTYASFTDGYQIPDITCNEFSNNITSSLSTDPFIPPKIPVLLMTNSEMVAKYYMYYYVGQVSNAGQYPRVFAFKGQGDGYNLLETLYVSQNTSSSTALQLYHTQPS